MPAYRVVVNTTTVKEFLVESALESADAIAFATEKERRR